MRGFDLDQLRTFAAVAEAGSLSAAAPLLHLSQSTVSEQVRKLETRAGVPLFVRSKRGVETTPAGARLLTHARRIVALNEAAFDDVRGQAIKGELPEDFPKLNLTTQAVITKENVDKFYRPDAVF